MTYDYDEEMHIEHSTEEDLLNEVFCSVCINFNATIDSGFSYANTRTLSFDSLAVTLGRWYY
jgi:hypothetical protein